MVILSLAGQYLRIFTLYIIVCFKYIIFNIVNKHVFIFIFKDQGFTFGPLASCGWSGVRPFPPHSARRLGLPPLTPRRLSPHWNGLPRATGRGGGENARLLGGVKALVAFGR